MQIILIAFLFCALIQYCQSNSLQQIQVHKNYNLNQTSFWQGWMLPQFHKKLLFQITCTDGVDAIYFSNIQIQPGTDLVAPECQFKENEFCQKIENCKQVSLQFQIGYCTNQTYIYIYSKNKNSQASLISDYIEGSCKGYSLDDQFQICSQKIFAEGLNNSCGICDTSCNVLKCGKYEQEKNKKLQVINSFCLPKETDKELLSTICKSYSEVENYTWRENCNRDQATSIFPPILKALLVIALFSGAAFFAYKYRKQIGTQIFQKQQEQKDVQQSQPQWNQIDTQQNRDSSEETLELQTQDLEPAIQTQQKNLYENLKVKNENKGEVQFVDLLDGR